MDDTIKLLTIEQLEEECRRGVDRIFSLLAQSYLHVLFHAMRQAGFSEDEAHTIATDALCRLQAQVRAGVEGGGVHNKQFRATDFLWKYCVKRAVQDTLRRRQKEQRIKTTSYEKLGEVLDGEAGDEDYSGVSGEDDFAMGGDSIGSANAAIDSAWSGHLDATSKDAAIDYRNPETIAIEGQDRRTVRSCIEKLPPKLATTMRLVLIMGLTHKEVAQILNLRRAETVSERKAKSLVALQECLEEGGFSHHFLPRPSPKPNTSKSNTSSSK